jgi:hypothetical protein
MIGGMKLTIRASILLLCSFRSSRACVSLNSWQSLRVISEVFRHWAELFAAGWEFARSIVDCTFFFLQHKVSSSKYGADYDDGDDDDDDDEILGQQR